MRIFTVLVLSLAALPAWAFDNWDEDLDDYARQLEAGHINLYHSISADDFRAELDAIRADAGAVPRFETVTRLMRLTRRINDGHTAMPLWNQSLRVFPFGVKLFEGEVFVTSAPKSYARLLGSRLVAIDDMPIEDVIAMLGEVVPFVENDHSRRVRVAQNLPKAELLNGLDITAEVDRARFTFENADGRVSETLPAGERDDGWVVWSFRDASMFEPVETIDESTWSGISADGSTIYVKFRRYPSMNDMANMAFGLLDEIETRKSRKLIIDMRENYGGDFFVGLKLAQALVLADSIDWQHGVYVLIDNETFSAAMSNAAQYRQMLNARLVGEPTGARPSGYQDMGQFTLPNSGLVVTYSKRHYRFASGEPGALAPDVRVTTSLEDYRLGRDPVLRWVQQDIEAKR